MKTYNSTNLNRENRHPMDGKTGIRPTSKGEVMQHTITLQTDSFKGQLAVARYPNFIIDRTYFDAYEECIFEGEINNPEPMLVLSFALKGDVDNSFHSEDLHSVLRADETALTLVMSDSKNSRKHLMPQQTEAGHVFTTLKYIKQLAERFPDELSNISSLFDKTGQNHILQESRKPTPLIANNIQNLMLPTYLGNNSESFMEEQFLNSLSLMTASKNINDVKWNKVLTNEFRSKMYDALYLLQRDFRKPVSLRQLAIAVGTNECYLKAGFRHEFHQSIFAYLFEYRMQMAIRYLRETQKSIEQISMLVGYEYAAHFITAFKRRFRITPLEFRIREKKR